MINFKSSIKNLFKEFKINKCGVVLLSSSIGLTSTGCIEVNEFEEVSTSVSSTENNTYYVLTEDVTTTSSETTSMKKETIVIPFEEECLPEIKETESKDIINGEYRISDGYAKYEVEFDDTLESISSMTGISIDEIKENNKIESDVINEGDSLILKARLVKYYINDIKNVSEISQLTGVDIDEICRLNQVPNDFNFKENKGIIVKALFFNENFYDTRIGRANIINNNIIFGDKVVRNDNNYMVLKNDSYFFGMNEVLLYTFEGSNYTSEQLFSNVRDIDLINNVPVAYIRTEDDLNYIMDIASYYNYLVDYDKLVTYSNYEYPMYLDYNNELIYTYDGEQHDFCCYTDSKVYN